MYMLLKRFINRKADKVRAAREEVLRDLSLRNLADLKLLNIAIIAVDCFCLAASFIGSYAFPNTEPNFESDYFFVSLAAMANSLFHIHGFILGYIFKITLHATFPALALSDISNRAAKVGSRKQGNTGGNNSKKANTPSVVTPHVQVAQCTFIQNDDKTDDKIPATIKDD